ncbi:hypothetical protein Tco_0750514 [Tanacetum coccineum]|uniref:Uncharacterized protein n=1 Tax=Tanacetum coccineum TaxID=301880 RepID=A0ABQ4Z4N8_9ASTR
MHIRDEGGNPLKFDLREVLNYEDSVQFQLLNFKFLSIFPQIISLVFAEEVRNTIKDCFDNKNVPLLIIIDLSTIPVKLASSAEQEKSIMGLPLAITLKILELPENTPHEANSTRRNRYRRHIIIINLYRSLIKIDKESTVSGWHRALTEQTIKLETRFLVTTGTSEGWMSSAIPLLVGKTVSFVTSVLRSTTLGEEVVGIIERELDKGELGKPVVD